MLRKLLGRLGRRGAVFSYKVGENIELRLLEEYDAERIYDLVDSDRAHLREWLPWVDDQLSPADSRAFVMASRQQFADNNGFQAGIWVKGEFAGMIGFHYFNFMHRKTEIGYWLGQKFEGNGIMTRSCRAMVNYAFKEVGLNRIEIRCATGNTRSCAIPDRLGFTFEGIQRQAEWLYDHFSDLKVYSLLASEWQDA